MVTTPCVSRLEDCVIRHFFIRTVQQDGSRDVQKLLDSFPFPATLKKAFQRLDPDFVEFANCYKDIIDFEEHVDALVVTNMRLDQKETVRNLYRTGSSSLILYQVLCLVAGMEQKETIRNLYKTGSSSLILYQVLCLVAGMEQEIREFLSVITMFVDLKPTTQTDTVEGLVVSLWAFRELLEAEELSEIGQDEILMPIKSAMICCYVNQWTAGLKMLLRVTKDRRQLFTPEVFIEVFLYIFNRLARTGRAESLSLFLDVAGDVLDYPGFHHAFCEENQAGRLPVEKFALLYSLVPEYEEIKRLMVALHRYLPRHDITMLMFKIDRDLGDEERKNAVIDHMTYISQLAAQ
uniref:Vacuolar protein sorting-associated protein 8 homolog n=1 Tax=Steinernema glaseri TaxID=37863 RepID=A0A1I7Y634_9BILA